MRSADGSFLRAVQATRDRVSRCLGDRRVQANATGLTLQSPPDLTATPEGGKAHLGIPPRPVGRIDRQGSARGRSSGGCTQRLYRDQARTRAALGFRYGRGTGLLNHRAERLFLSTAAVHASRMVCPLPASARAVREPGTGHMPVPAAACPRTPSTRILSARAPRSRRPGRSAHPNPCARGARYRRRSRSPASDRPS